MIDEGKKFSFGDNAFSTIGSSVSPSLQRFNPFMNFCEIPIAGGDDLAVPAFEMAVGGADGGTAANNQDEVGFRLLVPAIGVYHGNGGKFAADALHHRNAIVGGLAPAAIFHR